MALQTMLGIVRRAWASSPGNLCVNLANVAVYIHLVIHLTLFTSLREYLAGWQQGKQSMKVAQSR